MSYSSLPPDQAFLGADRFDTKGFNGHDEAMEKLYNPHTHTRMTLILPFGVPGAEQNFELWNRMFEQWLQDAYLPSVPVWVTNDTLLTRYANPAGEQSKTFVKGQVISHCSRVTTAVRNDNYNARWLNLTQAQRRALLIQRFEIEAVDAVRGGYPYPRHNTPELTLDNLLRDNGKGFVELAESLCYPLRLGNEMIGREEYPILQLPSWERLMGVSSMYGMSRYRRGYIDVGLMNRHLALNRCVDRVFAELAQPGDITPRPPAWQPSDKPRCSLCSRDITNKPLKCSACAKVKRNTFYCHKEHQVQHWKTGHKRTCGRTEDQIDIPSSFSTHTSARHPALEAVHASIQRQPEVYWTFKLRDGRMVGLSLPPCLAPLFTVKEQVDGLAEVRKIALQAYELADEVSTGTIALLLKVSNADAPEFDLKAALMDLGKMFKLGEGEEAVRVMEGRMAVARGRLEGPFVKRLLNFLSPVGLDDSATLRLIVRYRHRLVYNREGVWLAITSGQEYVLGPSSTFYPPREHAAALLEYRQVAFQVLSADDSPSEMSVGLMVNMVRTLTLKEGFYGLLNFDLEMEKLARIVGLPSGREGRRELERRAREALVDAAAKRQHPLLMRYLIDQVPKSVEAGHGVFLDVPSETTAKEEDVAHRLAALDLD